MKKNFCNLFNAIFISALLSGCIADPGLSKNTGKVTDFSLGAANNTNGCGASYLMWSQLGMCSTNACPAKNHIATAAEMLILKQYIADVISITPIPPATTNPAAGQVTPVAPNGQVPLGGTVNQNLLNNVNNSAGVCLNDVPPPRPTGQVFISSDFCSCLNGKSDIINDCTAACANYPATAKPTLYLNTTVGADIQLNQSLQNLQGWCKNLLPNDKANPQCTLSAWDGTNTIANIPLISLSGNSLTADLTPLSLNKTYVVKIVEIGTGSNAQSLEFQIRRVPPVVPISGQLGALKVAPISQYSCLSFGTNINPAGQVFRDTYVRQIFYFAANENPPPLPPVATGTVATMVCHDEALHPGNDSMMYPRFELVPQHFSMWDKSDQRFAADTAGKLKIHSIIEQRLLNEFNITATGVNLFTLTTLPNRPTQVASGSTAAPTGAIPTGFRMIAFLDPLSGKTMCPTRTDFLTTTDPTFMILKDYVDTTEALYLGEKEAELIGGATVYGTMMVTEGILKKYAFYIENGMKIKADQAALNSKTIYYYWPVNNTMDPLLQGTRKLFTVRSSDTLNGQQSSVVAPAASDKRVGCVPTTTVP